MAKVVFCQRVVYSYFGVMSISAVLKKNKHECDVVLGSNIDQVVGEVSLLAPDIAAFSTLAATGEFEWALKTAQKLKRNNPNLITVFGSIQPTLFPDKTIENDAIDIICRGEGEYPMLELCGRVDSGQSYEDIEGFWVRTNKGIKKNPIRQLIEDLDQLPFPDRELYQKYGYFDDVYSIDVLAGRACPFDCSYCYNHIMRELLPAAKGMVRKNSVDYVIAQLIELKQMYKARSFTFVDELFAFDKLWLQEFSEKYKKSINLPFICNIRADLAGEDIIELLAAAGASRVCLGLETGNEELRKQLLNKPITNQQFIDTAERLHRHGIKFLTANMLGLPGETIEKAFETVELNYRIKADYLYFSIFQPYPGLKITKNAETSGQIGCDIRSGMFNSTYFKNSILKQPEIKELVNLHKLFYFAVRLFRFKKVFKLIIKLPANFIFDLIFIISFGWMQLTCFRRSPRQLLAMGIGNLKVFCEGASDE